MYKLLSFPFVRLLYYVGKVYGYMPFRYSHHPPKAERSVTSITYSVLYATILSMAIPMLQFTAYQIVVARRFIKTTLLIVIALNYSVLTIRTILGCIQQVFNRNQFIGLINDGYRLNEHFRAITNDESIINIRSIDAKCTRLLTTKLVSAGVQLLIVIGGVLTEYYNNQSVLLVALVALNTHGLYMLTTSTYFCAMIVALRFYCLLNRRLKSTMARIEDVVASQKNKMKMQLFCQISDDIDRLDRLYDKLSMFTGKINDLYSFQLLLAIIASFGYALTGFFYVYNHIVNILHSSGNASAIEILTDVSLCCYYMIEIQSIVWISQLVMQEAARTGRILYKVAIDIDDRLNQSIELFSLQVLHKAPTITACGMFTIDNTLIYGMVGTFASYLTLLIQFELADTHVSNAVAAAASNVSSTTT